MNKLSFKLLITLVAGLFASSAFAVGERTPNVPKTPGQLNAQSSSFVSFPSAPAPNLAAEAITGGGFEDGTPNPYWNEASTNFGTPLCTTFDCGFGGGTGPYAGDWWAWFGGSGLPEASSVSQDILIPVGSATLSFFLEVPVCDTEADYMVVELDGNEVFDVDGGSALCGVQSYAEQTVDLSAYADGGVHTLEFRSETFSLGDNVITNFFVDNVSVETAPPEMAKFLVSKEFTDDNPSEVEVTLSCFTGLPLVQSQMISEVQDVNFIVESFAQGELDCNVTEEDLFGYSASYDDGTIVSEDSCEYVDLIGGQYSCAITNSPDPVTVDVEKVWIIDGPGGDSVDQYYRLTMFCSSEIVGGEQILLIGSAGVPGPGPGCGGIFLGTGAGDSIRGSDSGELWCLEMEGYGSELFTPEVIPDYPNSLCLVWETVYDSGVEVDNGCAPRPEGSGELLVVSAGVGDSCTITNTVFFEGIPTLSQYGMAILALLMLGVGFVGFRRFA